MGAWLKSLEPRVDELVIAKQYPSAFGPSLASTLTSLGIDSVEAEYADVVSEREIIAYLESL